MSTSTWILAYFVLVNIAGFASMGIDKAKAKKHEWRISEAMLFFFAIIGGALGSFLGMKIFHHKTKHWYFAWGLPIILILWIALISYFAFGNSIPIFIW